MSFAAIKQTLGLLFLYLLVQVSNFVWCWTTGRFQISTKRWLLQQGHSSAWARMHPACKHCLCVCVCVHCLSVLSAALTADKSQTQHLALELPEIPELEWRSKTVQSGAFLCYIPADVRWFTRSLCTCVCVCMGVRVCVCVWLWWFRGSCLFRLSVDVSRSGSSSQRYNSAARLLKIFQILPKPNSPLTSEAQMSNNQTGNSSCLKTHECCEITWSGIYLQSDPVYHPLLKKFLAEGERTQRWL